MDQLAFLTLSGISYAYANNGAARTSGAFASLAFAADVEAPTSKRHRRWDSTLVFKLLIHLCRCYRCTDI